MESLREPLAAGLFKVEGEREPIEFSPINPKSSIERKKYRNVSFLVPGRDENHIQMHFLFRPTELSILQSQSCRKLDFLAELEDLIFQGGSGRILERKKKRKKNLAVLLL